MASYRVPGTKQCSITCIAHYITGKLDEQKTYSIFCSCPPDKIFLPLSCWGKCWFWLLCGLQEAATNFPCQRSIKTVAFTLVFFLRWREERASFIAEGTAMQTPFISTDVKPAVVFCAFSRPV